MEIVPAQLSQHQSWLAARRRLNPKPKVEVKINDLTPNAVPMPLKIGTPQPEYSLTYGRPRRLMIDDFIRAACKHFNVSRIDFLSDRRPKNLFMPRQIAAYLARTMTGNSLPEIGRRFGGKDHTTIMHSVRKIERLRLEDDKVNADVEAIRSAVQSSCDAYQTTGGASCNSVQTTAI